MGQVTFKGDQATRESMAYIKAEEQRILRGRGDQYVMANRLQQFYNEQGIIDGNGQRAGSQFVHVDNGPAPRREQRSSSSGSDFGLTGLFQKAMGMLIGLILLVVACILMSVFNT